MLESLINFLVTGLITDICYPVAPHKQHGLSILGLALFFGKIFLLGGTNGQNPVSCRLLLREGKFGGIIKGPKLQLCLQNSAS